MICNRTCHKNCVFSDDNEKRDCCSIDSKTGKCKKCDKNCDWTSQFIFEYYEDEEEKTYDELKKNFWIVKVRFQNFNKYYKVWKLNMTINLSIALKFVIN